MKKIMILCVTLMSFACTQAQPGADVPLSDAREYAGALYNQQLYWQAINEYGRILDIYTMDADARANINYTIGNIYFDEFSDYTNSLSFFLKIKYLYKDSPVASEANKKVIACLERLGRSSAAASLLKETTSAAKENSPFANTEGDTLAVIGERVLTTGEFDLLYKYYRNTLPSDARMKDATRDEKLAFLSDFVKSETLYNSAKIQKIDEDREVLQVAYLQHKQLMIQKLLENEINKKVTVSDDEIKTWYDGNKEKLKPAGSSKIPNLQESRDNIRQYIQAIKSQVMQNELTDRLIEAQNAKIFPDRIK